MSSDGNNDCRDLSWSLYMVSLDEKPCIHRVMKVRPTVTLLVNRYKKSILAFYHSTLYQHPVEVQAIRKVKAQANQLYRRSFHCPLSVSHPTSLNCQYGAQRVTWTRTRESRDAVTNG
ncbi:unnamed protein product [Arabidopsis halleri]